MGDQFTEAPASVTVRFTLRGYDTMLTLRDVSGRELLAKLGPALDALEGMGAQAGGAGNGHAADNGDVKMCALHGVAMKRHEKNGQSWYSHKDGAAWCRGGEAK